MNTLETLFEKIERSKDLDFGTIIDNVIGLFKKVWQKGLVLILLIVLSGFIIGLVFSLIGLAPDGNYMIDGQFNFQAFIDLYFKNVLLGVPQNILMSALTLSFLAAFYRMCRLELEREIAQDDFFYFFKNGYFSKLLTLGMIYTGISTLAQLLFAIPFIYVYVPLSYFAVFFAFNPDLSEMELVKASFKLGTKKWFISFGVMFTAGFLGMLGVLACGVGLLVTMAIAYLPAFFIYKAVIGFNEKDIIDDIGMPVD